MEYAPTLQWNWGDKIPTYAFKIYDSKYKHKKYVYIYIWFKNFKAFFSSVLKLTSGNICIGKNGAGKEGKNIALREKNGRTRNYPHIFWWHHIIPCHYVWQGIKTIDDEKTIFYTSY